MMQFNFKSGNIIFQHQKIMPCREEFESELRKCKEMQNLIIDQSISKYKFKDRVCEHVK